MSEETRRAAERLLVSLWYYDDEPPSDHRADVDKIVDALAAARAEAEAAGRAHGLREAADMADAYSCMTATFHNVVPGFIRALAKKIRAAAAPAGVATTEGGTSDGK